MTNTNPFGTQVADAPTAADPNAPLVDGGDAEGTPSRRPLVLVLVLVVTLAVAGGAWLLLGSGGSETVPASTAPDTSGTQADTPAEPKAEAVPQEPELRDASGVRDPFDPLVSDEAAPATGETDTGTTTETDTGTTAGTDTGTTTGAITGGTTGTPSGGSTDPAPAAKPETVTLKVVAMTNMDARVRVAGKAYTVSEGDKFAGGFRLMNLARLPGSEHYYGVFKYKDRSSFDLFEGRTHKVTTRAAH
ncbi:MAG: hypothetical protein ACRDYU_15045 [Actinomycetes bacterium]